MHQRFGYAPFHDLVSAILTVERQATIQTRSTASKIAAGNARQWFWPTFTLEVRRVLFLHVICRHLLELLSDNRQALNDTPQLLDEHAFLDEFRSQSTFVPEVESRMEPGTTERVDECVLKEVLDRLNLLRTGRTPDELAGTRLKVRDALFQSALNLFGVRKAPVSQGDHQVETFQSEWRSHVVKFLELADASATNPTSALPAVYLLKDLEKLPSQIGLAAQQMYSVNTLSKAHWTGVLGSLAQQRILIGITTVQLLLRLKPQRNSFDVERAREWKEELELRVKCREEILFALCEENKKLHERLQEEWTRWARKEKSLSKTVGKPESYKLPSLPNGSHTLLDKISILESDIAKVKEYNGWYEADLRSLEKRMQEHNRKLLPRMKKSLDLRRLFPMARSSASRSVPASNSSASSSQPERRNNQFFANPRN